MYHFLMHKNIEDWALECKFDFEIANIWRAKISNKEGNSYTFKICEYNSIFQKRLYQCLYTANKGGIETI